MKQHATVGNRRAFCTLLALAGVALTAPAAAQSYPSKPIRLVVSFAPGGAGDFLARLYQLKLQEKYTHGVIVENKPGASGTIGADLVAKAAPDGYTFLVTNQLIIQAPNLIKKMPYDPMKDLIPVTDIGGAPVILAVNTATTKAKTLKEFVDEVKRKPKTFSYASVGAGSMGNLYGAQLNDVAGIDLLHVPYKGSAPVVQALVAGEVQSAFTDYATMKPHLETGKLQLLAVSKPYPPLPNLKTFAEQGYEGLDAYSWIGVFAPAKTPAAIVQELAAEITRISKLPDVVEKLDTMGLGPAGMPQKQFAAMVESDFLRWGTIMKKVGIKAE